MRRGVLAFIGERSPGDGVADVASRFGLRSIDGLPGLQLYAGTAIPDRVLPDGTVVLGEIFSLSGATCLTPADGWGDYLAFSSDASVPRIDRASLTGMPLYWCRYGKGLLCTSHFHLIEGLLGEHAVDWEFVAHSLSYINLRTERTGIVGLLELLPGTRIEFDGRAVRISTLWSPWRHVGKSNSQGIADLASAVERCLVGTVGCWSRERPEILLELSGGLDSSVVAAALTAADARFSAINFVTQGSDGDERNYARAVAERCGIEIIEAPLEVEAVDLLAPISVALARPGSYAVLGGIDSAFEAAVGAREFSIFGGIAGDNVFAFDNTVAPILDAYSRFGPGRRAFETLRDVARCGEATVWQALRLAFRAYRRGPRFGWRRETLFLQAAAVPMKPFVHPWDEGVATASQAKRNHVEAVRRILDFVDRPGRWHDRDVVAPLLSQPLVELCLSIPSWTWISGGRDRAVARAAFAKRLPPEVVWRRGKGRIESFAATAYRKQKTKLREFILDGRLAARGLLDRSAIETYATRDLVLGDYDYFRLLEIADVERWVRSIESLPLTRPSDCQRAY